MGTLFGRQSYFQCTKKWTRRTRQALRSIISNFKYRHQPENAKKKIHVIGTLNSHKQVSQQILPFIGKACEQQ